LMIAHRVTSLRNCDQILQIKHGKAEIVHGFTAELVTTP
jgi:ABC-type multidrug transport system fused ATPase/permease subunit